MTEFARMAGYKHVLSPPGSPEAEVETEDVVFRACNNALRDNRLIVRAYFMRLVTEEAIRQKRDGG